MTHVNYYCQTCNTDVAESAIRCHCGSEYVQYLESRVTKASNVSKAKRHIIALIARGFVAQVQLGYEKPSHVVTTDVREFDRISTGRSIDHARSTSVSGGGENIVRVYIL